MASPLKHNTCQTEHTCGAKTNTSDSDRFKSRPTDKNPKVRNGEHGDAFVTFKVVSASLERFLIESLKQLQFVQRKKPTPPQEGGAKVTIQPLRVMPWYKINFRPQQDSRCSSLSVGSALGGGFYHAPQQHHSSCNRYSAVKSSLRIYELPHTGRQGQQRSDVLVPIRRSCNCPVSHTCLWGVSRPRRSSRVRSVDQLIT